MGISVSTCSSIALKVLLPLPSIICCSVCCSCASIRPSASTSLSPRCFASAAPTVLLPLPGIPIREIVSSAVTGEVIPTGEVELRCLALKCTQAGCSGDTDIRNYVPHSGVDHPCKQTSVEASLQSVLMSPVALCFELLREVIHLVSEHAFLGQVVPLVGIWTKGYCQQRHVCFLRRLAIL